MQENLSKNMTESLACGASSVAFNIGGIRDMIEHQVNGYLAKPFDVSYLATGIDWILSDENRQAYSGLKNR